MNTFKHLFDEYNEELLNELPEKLSSSQKGRLVKRTKLHVFIREFLENFQENLEQDETVKAYLPLSPGANSAAANVGLLGMAYARTAQARNYVTTFNDVRGNRLLIFTDQRIIFLTMVDYLEEGLFYSYAYEDIQKIRFAPHKVGYFDWSGPRLPKRKHFYWYTLDFQAKNNIFTEMLSETDAQLLRQQLQNISALQEKLGDGTVQRRTTFDYFFSNTSLWLKIAYAISILFTLIMLTALIISVIRAFRYNQSGMLSLSLVLQQLQQVTVHLRL